VQLDARINYRIWLAAKNFDLMTEIDQRFCQMTRVNALTTDMWFAAICEIRDSYWTVDIKRFGH
jgi:hypothetical protein